MQKWLNIVFMALLMSLACHATTDVTCDISLENTTWESINLTKWHGTISDMEKVGVVNTLSEDTRYYLRCKNTTANFSYVSFRTLQGGGGSELILSITVFLLLINIAIFILPEWLRLDDKKVSHYVGKRMLWISAIFLIWFNTTLFRELASSYDLGIDGFLETYWYLFTFVCMGSIFILLFVAVVGAIRLMRAVKFRLKYGGDNAT